VSYALVGLYGLYLMFVGIKGNSTQLKDFISADFKGFWPWLIAILVLRAAYNVDALKPVVKPFIYLAVLTFVLKNYGKLVYQANQITGLSLPGATNG